ncbi:hypothetical protein V6N11_015169 [Hibiscus sabdariffa]|uniref:Uncharacterized protein n=1 Tax=Hibiscus sabdariffa TaxID=183260 RepID=A0ABR2TRB5_9ROSI
MLLIRWKTFLNLEKLTLHFEQSLANQQLWAKQLADAQEAKIKAAVQQITLGAAEVSEVRLGKNIVTPEVKLEDVNSERGTGELEPQLQSPSWQFSRYRSTKRDLGNFDSDTRYDHHKDHRRSRNYHRVSRSPNDDSNPHHERSTDSRKRREMRGASPLEGSWKRGRSTWKSKPQRYCHEDSYSPRSGRYHGTVYGRPADDSIPHDRRPIVGEKHRERRRASPVERSRKRERSPSKTRLHEDSRKVKNYRRSSGDDSNRHGRSIDSRRYREKRGASPSERGKIHKSRHILAEDQNDGQGNDSDAEISDPTGRKSECRSKGAMDENSRNYTTSGGLNAKAPHSASVCANNPQNHPA